MLIFAPPNLSYSANSPLRSITFPNRRLVAYLKNCYSIIWPDCGIRKDPAYQPNGFSFGGQFDKKTYEIAHLFAK